MYLGQVKVTVNLIADTQVTHCYQQLLNIIIYLFFFFTQDQF